jgi:von Willebrand factor type A domain
MRPSSRFRPEVFATVARLLRIAALGALGSIAAGAFGGACTFSPKRVMPQTGTGGLGMSGAGTGGWTTPLDLGQPLTDAAREYVSAPDAGEDAGPSVDANCGNQPFEVVIPPPNLMIVLDRSQSMTEDATGNRNNVPVAMQKWGLMTTAINDVVGKTEDTIRWGLMFFGSDSACGAETTATVPPALKNAKAISDAIAGTTPQSYTPTAKGEMAAGTYLNGFKDMGRKFILLATDGQPTCGPPSNTGTDADDPAAIQAVSTVSGMGIPTYVIGIATTGSAKADETLNSMAVMGGQPRNATPKYYPVSTTADLVTALGEIKTLVMGMCTYPLGTPSENSDITKTTVTVDGMSVPQGDPDGWDFDPGNASVTFKGSTCTKLMAGTAMNVRVLYGCKIVVM